MLHNVVGGSAQDILSAVRLLLGYSRRANIFFKEFNRFCHLLHQCRKRRSEQRNLQPAEQLQQWSGSPHDRIGIGGGEFVDAQGRPLPACMGRHLRFCRSQDPVFARVSRGRSAERRGGSRRRRARFAGLLGTFRRRVRLQACRRSFGWPLHRWLRHARSGRRIGCRQSSAGIWPDDSSIAPAEWIRPAVVLAHRRSSMIAHRSSSRSGQSPEKCMPIEPAVLNSGHSADFRSR